MIRNNHGYYFPSKLHTSLHAFLNEYSVRHESLIDYLKIIPEFNRISINDKIRSVQNHFGTMLTLNESINQANRNDNLVLTLNNIFGMELAKGQLRYIQLVQVYGQDPILLKLVLIIEGLSSGVTLYQDDLDMIVFMMILNLYLLVKMFMWNYYGDIFYHIYLRNKMQ